MSEKIRDEKNRWRNKIVAFRVSEEESVLLDKYVKISGLTKQDYLTLRVLKQDVVVHGNSRVYMAMKESLSDVLKELEQIETLNQEHDELLQLIEHINMTLNGLKLNEKSPYPGR